MTDQASRHPSAGRTRVAAVAIAVLLALVFSARIRNQMPDFEVYWRAGDRAQVGEWLYRAEDGHYQLKYLPAFALAMAPLALVPLPVAKAIWFAVSVASIAALVALSLATWPRRRVSRRWLTILTIVLMTKFYAHELTLGQSNALMAALVMLSLVALFGSRERRAGLLLAGAVLVKPYAIGFLPYLALRRRWTACAWMGIGTASILLAPALVYGVGGNSRLLADWASALRDSTAPNLLGQDNVSVWAMYAKWLGSGALAFWLGAATVGALALVVLWLIAASDKIVRSEYLECATILMLLPLCSPQGWDYVLLVATPAVLALLDARTALPSHLRVAATIALPVMGLSVFDLMGRRAYAAFMSLSSITVCALVLLVAVVELRRRRIA